MFFKKFSIKQSFLTVETMLNFGAFDGAYKNRAIQELKILVQNFITYFTEMELTVIVDI